MNKFFKILQRPEYTHVNLKCMSRTQEEYKLNCQEMPFFVMQKAAHTLSVISTQNEQLLIISYVGGKRPIEVYRASVCKWETTEITLPNGSYFVGNGKSKCEIRIIVKDDE